MASDTCSVDDLDFGEIYVVNPTTVHSATIVWLHDIGGTGQDSEYAVKYLRIPNIKWICPTAPVRPVTSLGGKRATAWFDVYSSISEGMRDDLDSLNYANTYVALLLSFEPSHVQKGVGGFAMGAAQALFYASSYVFGSVLTHAEIIIGVDGWLPDLRNLEANMNQHSMSALFARSMRILITHGISAGNNVATFAPRSFVKKCFDSLHSHGFLTLFKECGGIQTMHEIRFWLS